MKTLLISLIFMGCIGSPEKDKKPTLDGTYENPSEHYLNGNSNKIQYTFSNGTFYRGSYYKSGSNYCLEYEREGKYRISGDTVVMYDWKTRESKECGEDFVEWDAGTPAVAPAFIFRNISDTAFEMKRWEPVSWDLYKKL